MGSARVPRAVLSVPDTTSFRNPTPHRFVAVVAKVRAGAADARSTSVSPSPHGTNAKSPVSVGVLTAPPRRTYTPTARCGHICPTSPARPRRTRTHPRPPIPPPPSAREPQIDLLRPRRRCRRPVHRRVHHRPHLRKPPPRPMLTRRPTRHRLVDLPTLDPEFHLIVLHRMNFLLPLILPSGVGHLRGNPKNIFRNFRPVLQQPRIQSRTPSVDRRPSGIKR